MSLLTSRIMLGISLLMMYIMNYMSSSGMLGTSMTQLSSIFPFEYMPPGWMFGISRGLIFVLLAVWYGLLWRRDLSGAAQQSFYRSERKRAMISILLNISWLLFTAQEWYLAAAAVIIALMAVLAQLLRLYRGRDLTRGGITRGVYYGWITVATTVLTISIIAHVLSGFDPSSIALTTSWTRGVRAGGLIMVLWSYRHYRSLPALIWSLIAMGTSAYAFFS